MGFDLISGTSSGRNWARGSEPPAGDRSSCLTFSVASFLGGAGLVMLLYPGDTERPKAELLRPATGHRVIETFPMRKAGQTKLATRIIPRESMKKVVYGGR